MFKKYERIFLYLAIFLALPLVFFSGAGFDHTLSLLTGKSDSGTTSSNSTQTNNSSSKNSNSNKASSKPTPGKSSQATTGSSKNSSTGSGSSPSSSGALTGSTGGIKTGAYGYTGHKDATDTNLPPVLEGFTKGSTSGGAAFQLPDIASASNILKLFQKDYPNCKTVADPASVGAMVLPGSVGADTLSACSEGDIKGKGYVIYFVTDKATVQKYQDKNSTELFKNFKSPIPSSLESVYFTPSSRAIVFSTGGEYAFDAGEVAWGVLFNLGYTPPKR